ncbi:MAG: AI-2E family transporter [Muribaculaceae bacterium]|jgi:predicted PurR-regulated permease PerM|nr:AI-2E family transporter [Muribaculaceae bacterium]
MEALKRPFTFDRVVRILFTVICVVAALWIINYLKGVLLPFIVACLLAYLIDPFVKFNQRWMHLKSRVFPTIFTLIEIAVVITAFFWFFIPYITHEISDMIVMLKKYTQTQMNVPYLPTEVHTYIKKYIDINQLSTLLTKEQWMKLFTSVANSTWSVVGGTLSVILSILSWFIVLLYLVFILIDYDRLMGSFKKAVPVKYRKGTYKIFHDVESSMQHYFRGQALVSFFVGISFCIGFSIINLPLAIVMGIIIGILNMVPYLQLASIPFVAFLCLVSTVTTGQNFWALFGEAIAVYCISQLIQDLFLTPKIMGKFMGLNPAVIFLSLSLWAYLLGFIGLIIALPLTTLLISYYDQYVIHDGERNPNTLNPPGGHDKKEVADGNVSESGISEKADN